MPSCVIYEMTIECMQFIRFGHADPVHTRRGVAKEGAVGLVLSHLPNFLDVLGIDVRPAVAYFEDSFGTHHRYEWDPVNGPAPTSCGWSPQQLLDFIEQGNNVEIEALHLVIMMPLADQGVGCQHMHHA